MERNYIFPFLWMRGEDEQTIRTEMEKIHQANIGAVCVEARPHPDFAGEGWWRDMDIVLDEAKKRQMKVWILDDAHFPTGQANGIIPKKYPERARRYVYTQHVDVTGPIPYGTINVEMMTHRKVSWMDFMKPHDKPIYEEQYALSVTAARIIEGDTISSEMVSLDDHVKDGILTWDVPAGTWRVFVNFVTTDCGFRNDYINYIDAESVKAQIEAAYEPHYERYKDEFGKTIVGFFSDEPGFYNSDGFDMDEAIGRRDMALPWCKEMEEKMEESMGKEWKKQLPYLFYGCENEAISSDVRFHYMDQVTRLYQKNFSMQIGNWCHDHGVMYIGHVIEDNNQHSHLGSGAGHFFRALSGQDMAGIDNIGNQIIPGRPDAGRHTPAYIGDGEFFHYGLAKLGASCAQIDPKKQGRFMCENFGAYGWSMGVKNMKWLSDYLMVQGVNHFVPHAFSMAEYPDNDCPPHFYARENNVQYPFFGKLMAYVNKVCNQLNGGVNVPQAAVLYEGEADWMGDTMRAQKISRELLENQIDFEIIPSDVFLEREHFGTMVQDNRLIVNGREMKALIIPGCDSISTVAGNFIMDHPSVPVIFVGRKPTHIPGIEDLSFLRNCRVLAMEELVPELRSLGCKDLMVTEPVRNLMVYHYVKEESDIYYLMNTSLAETIETSVILPVEGAIAQVDLWNDTCMFAGEGMKEIPISLPPYGAVMLISHLPEEAMCEPEGEKQFWMDLSKGWEVSLKEYGKGQREFTDLHMDDLKPVSQIYPDFSGVMTYTKSIHLSEVPAKVKLSVEHLYEAAEVYVNGTLADCRITPPYVFDLKDLLKEGENTIKIHCVNTQVRNANRTPGIFGIDWEILEPSGMFGKVELLK